MMKKKKQFFRGVIIGTALIVLLAASLTTSYLTDREIAYNIVTIGNVEVTIDETPFDPTSSYPADAGTVIGKAPKLKNEGTTDEYVFIKVSVPKKTVTFLDETTGKKDGNTNPRTGEIFKLLTNDTGTKLIKDIDDTDLTDVTFYYHKGDNSVDGWYLVDTATATVNSVDYNVYTFGYNKKLKPGDSTKTLFDKIQLKSIIDTEVKGDVSIQVGAYAIQSDELNLSGIANDYDGLLSTTNVETIYNIVKNKGGV